MNKHVKLNMDIIFGSVLMLCSKVEKNVYTPLEDIDHQSWLEFF